MRGIPGYHIATCEATIVSAWGPGSLTAPIEDLFGNIEDGIKRLWSRVDRLLLLAEPAPAASRHHFLSQPEAQRLHFVSKRAAKRLRGQRRPHYDESHSMIRRLMRLHGAPAVPLAGTGPIEGIRGRIDERRPDVPTPILGDDAKSIVIGQTTYVNELDPLAIAAMAAGGYEPPMPNKSRARITLAPFTPPNEGFAPSWSGQTPNGQAFDSAKL